MQDLRLATRRLSRQPFFSLAVILLCALGVGAGTAVFTLANALLLQPPPLVGQPETLVRLNPAPENNGAAGYPDYQFYRDNAQAFTHLFGYDGVATTVQLRQGERMEEGAGRFVTGNFFSGLALAPVAGRILTPDDDSEQAENVLVVTEAFATRWFGSLNSALGQNLSVSGFSFRVVGVIPSGFRGAAHDDTPVDLWMPVWKRLLVLGRPRLDMVRTPDYRHTFLTVMARLRPGTSIVQAQANLDALTSQLRRDTPDVDAAVTLSSSFALSPNRRDTVSTLSMLIGALAVIVLLIVCANLGNLMLARASARRSELAVKLALGAARTRLVREFSVESLLLTTLGGAAGLLFAVWAAQGLAAFLPFEVASAASPNLKVVGLAIGLTALTALICAAAPAWLAARVSAVHDASTRTTGGGAATRTALVVTQVALSFVLLVGATAFVRTLKAVHDLPLGFNPDPVLLASFNAQAHGYNQETGAVFYEQLLQRMRALPGVQSAALGSLVPLGGGRRTGEVSIEGRTEDPERPLILDSNVVGPGYFQTMGIQLVRGRDFNESDRAGTSRVAIINERMAREFWPGQDPLGKRFTRGQPMEVIGVVADTRSYQVTAEPVPIVYLPFAQAYFPRMIVFMQTSEPARLASAVQTAVAELDANVVIRRMEPQGQIYETAIRGYTVNARLVSVLGALALFLSAIGLYAVTSYLVLQRGREFGVRLAIGARPVQLLRNVLGGALQRTALGLAIGVIGSRLLVSLIERFLFDISPTDPVTFVMSAVLLAAAMMVASWWPAWRAMKVDPLRVLRTD